MPSLVLLAAAACGSWQRVGQETPGPTPAEQLPQLTDPSLAYREMGLLADNGPLGFVGTARILAGSDDSLLVLVALSLRNRGFTFRRDGDQFVADYRVEISLRSGTSQAALVQRDERIRVAAFRETQRTDESVIFQQFVKALPGDYVLAVMARDRNSNNSGRVEVPMTVPPLEDRAVSLPIAVYQATPRTTLAEPPALIANPRSAVPFGTDTLRFYIETYGIQPGLVLQLSAVDGQDRVTWRDSLRVDSLGPVRGYVIALPPALHGIGRYQLRLSQRGNNVAVTPFMVAFSDQYAVAKLEDIVSLLRYFAPPDTLRALVNAPAEQRGALWQQFWRSTDPNPATPENEAIDEYLRRVQVSNELFRDESIPGWLTERGEVYINLGEPTEVRENRGDATGRGRQILWSYQDYRLTLLFYDDTGFGRLRLEPRSRSEFLRTVNRLRDNN